MSSIDFSTVKSVAIPAGDVKKIEIGGVTVWEKSTSILPSEYQQVEYIQSSGTQYINPSVTTDTAHSFALQADFEQPTTATTKQSVVGTDTLDINVKSGHMFYGNSTWQTTIGTERTTARVYCSALTENDNYIKKLWINGTAKDDVTSTWRNGEAVIVFASTVNTTVKNKASVKLYSAVIEYNEAVVRNLVPCYRISDNEIGMYDTVSETFYTNAGSGTFSKGADVTT